MKSESSKIYGGSLVLATLLNNDYTSIGDTLRYFIAFQEFDKYVRYINYGISRKLIIDEICNDIEELNTQFLRSHISGDIKRWVTANFSYVYGLIIPEEDD